MEISRELVTMYEKSWFHFRDIRLERLRAALAINDEVSNERMDDRPSNYPWWPSEELVSSIQEEVLQLNEGIRLSDRYMIQDTMQEKYGRPLFSKTELTNDGGFLVEDPVHRHPSKANFDKRIEMVWARM